MRCFADKGQKDAASAEGNAADNDCAYRNTADNQASEPSPYLGGYLAYHLQSWFALPDYGRAQRCIKPGGCLSRIVFQLYPLCVLRFIRFFCHVICNFGNAWQLLGFQNYCQNAVSY